MTANGQVRIQYMLCDDLKRQCDADNGMIVCVVGIELRCLACAGRVGGWRRRVFQPVWDVDVCDVREGAERSLV
jgi:hypothetical protein